MEEQRLEQKVGNGEAGGSDGGDGGEIEGVRSAQCALIEVILGIGSVAGWCQ